MTNDVTNVASNIEIQNNMWTLTKHLAHSINKTAGKVDAKVYGPIVKERTVQLPPPAPVPAPPQDTSIFAIIGYVVVGLFVVAGLIVGFIAYCKGAVSGRDLLGF